MGWNLPDDWGMYYNKCGYCKSTYHASEGGCGCLEDHVECAGQDRYEECFVHEEFAIKIGDKHYCEEHARCDACGEKHEDVEWIKPYEGDVYCDACWEESQVDQSCAG